MTCQEVEIILCDFARADAVELGIRCEALAHLERCPACGERFEDEKKLSEGLVALAASTIDWEAPAQVEQRLRAAFRQRHGVEPAAPRFVKSWMIGAASIGSIAAALLLFHAPAPAPPPPSPPAKAPIAVSAAAPVAAPLAPPLSVRPHGRRRPPLRRAPEVEPPALAADFVAVPQGDEWSPRDGVRLVRVEIPEAALSAFGLAVEEGRGADRVQADVMLSDDGLLRAIRFVR